MRGESLFQVYYEDTDMAGIVYHANYLKFLERGRSDAVRDAGIDQVAMMRDLDMVFAVAHLSIDYLAPARLNDVLCVRTETARVGGAALDLRQQVLCGERMLVRAALRIACMTTGGAIRRIPADIRRRLADAGAGAR